MSDLAWTSECTTFAPRKATCGPVGYSPEIEMAFEGERLMVLCRVWEHAGSRLACRSPELRHAT